jgi:hypothetical protein
MQVMCREKTQRALYWGAMTKSRAKQELEKLRRFLKSLEDGEKVDDVQFDAGHYRRKVDEVIKFVKAVQE